MQPSPIDYESGRLLKTPSPYRRYFAIIRIIIVLEFVFYLCHIIEVQIDGHHNPTLWFWMPASDQWKGWVGIALRSILNGLGVSLLMLFVVDAIWFVVQVARNQINRSSGWLHVLLFFAAVFAFILLGYFANGLDR